MPMMRSFPIQIVSLAGLVIFTGCATEQPNVPPPMPTRLMPEMSPDNRQTLKAIKGGLVELGSGPYFAILKASLNDHQVYIQVLFNNEGKKPVSFGAENLTLADTIGLLVRSLTPADAAQPYVQQAQNAAAQAQAAAANAQQAQEQLAEFNHKEHKEEEERRRNGQDLSDGEKVADAFATTAVTLSAIGAQESAGRAAGDAQAAEVAAQTFSDRVSLGALRSQQVPPGTKTEGIVYFAEPAVWPATLRISVDGRTLAARYTPASARPEPPQVAVSKIEYLTGQSSVDFRTMAIDLRRSALVNSIFMEAIPLTPALVAAREQWRGFKNTLDPAEVKKNEQAALASLDPDKSEFEISLGAYDPAFINPDQWQATLIDSHKTEYPVTLVQIPQVNPSSFVTTYFKTRLNGKAAKIDFSQPFQLSLRRTGISGGSSLDVAWQTVQPSSSSVAPQLLKTP